MEYYTLTEMITAIAVSSAFFGYFLLSAFATGYIIYILAKG